MQLIFFNWEKHNYHVGHSFLIYFCEQPFEFWIFIFAILWQAEYSGHLGVGVLEHSAMVGPGSQKQESIIHLVIGKTQFIFKTKNKNSMDDEQFVLSFFILHCSKSTLHLYPLTLASRCICPRSLAKKPSNKNGSLRPLKFMVCTCLFFTRMIELYHDLKVHGINQQMACVLLTVICLYMPLVKTFQSSSFSVRILEDSKVEPCTYLLQGKGKWTLLTFVQSLDVSEEMIPELSYLLNSV